MLQCYLLWIFVSIRKLLQLIVCVGVSTPSYLKNMTPFFKIFLSLTPSHLLKVTKFLVEIFQFKFLVMTEIFFCHEIFQILIYFSCKNCNPMKKVTAFPPFFFLLFVKKYFIYQPPFALIMYFQNKTNFFFYLIAGWFWFCCFVYMCFLGCFFTFLLSWNNFHE